MIIIGKEYSKILLEKDHFSYKFYASIRHEIVGEDCNTFSVHLRPTHEFDNRRQQFPGQSTTLHPF